MSLLTTPQPASEFMVAWHELDGIYLRDVTDLTLLPVIFAFIFGGCLGSFANAAAMRLVRDESPVLPPSRCRFCDKQLTWRENMPLMGWLILAGRCGCRAKKLPARYVMVEWGFAIITAYLAYSVPLATFALLTVLNLIVMIALLTDSEAMVLHPPSLLAGILVSMLAPIVTTSWPITITQSMIGAVIGAGLIIGTNLIYRLMRGKNGFGQGDIWLLALIGACFGPIHATLIFFASSFIGAVAGIMLILAKKAETGSKLPFGLFLSLVFLLYPAINMLLI